MIYRLDDNEIWFPDPTDGDSDGRIAVGGDLSTERLMLAYHHGIFPWYPFHQAAYMFEDTDEILIQWWCPLDRFVIFPNEIHVSHSMRSLINKGTYKVSVNQDFDGVINNCSGLRDKDLYAWLGPDMVAAYKKLHELGYALSVEVWDSDDNLIGGLYGVLTAHVFCGESMFSLKPSASKLALIYLGQVLTENAISLIDCQFETEHLLSMGGRHISYDEYMKYMRGEKNQNS
ncbi:MAG: leucyl/phenylalanyl-tRNA--protein transferase [Bacteroidales bacterium]|nr:leucyl/phenylalanyl-tRNA--protein transferase [Bacteroidales bacterium]